MPGIIRFQNQVTVTDSQSGAQILLSQVTIHAKDLVEVLQGQLAKAPEMLDFLQTDGDLKKQQLPLHMQKLIQAADDSMGSEYADFMREFNSEMITRVHQDVRLCEEILALLTQSETSQTMVEVPNHLSTGLSLYAAEVMLSRRFVSIWCPVCKREYGPSPNETLLAVSDRHKKRITCLRRHTLYVCTSNDCNEW